MTNENVEKKVLTQYDLFKEYIYLELTEHMSFEHYLVRAIHDGAQISDLPEHLQEYAESKNK